MLKGKISSVKQENSFRGGASKELRNSSDGGVSKREVVECETVLEARIKAKLSFREMQLLDPEIVVKILSNDIVTQYRFFGEIASSDVQVNEELNLEQKGSGGSSLKKRAASVVKSEEDFQKKLWNYVLSEAKTILNGISRSSQKILAMEKLVESLRMKDLRHFLCKEQAIQIAFLQALKYFDDSKIDSINEYIKSVEDAVINCELKRAPDFFSELRRAVQLTISLRREAELIDNNTRVEHKDAMHHSSEFVLL